MPNIADHQGDQYNVIPEYDFIAYRRGNTYYVEDRQGHALLAPTSNARNAIERAANSLGEGSKGFLGPYVFELDHAIDVDNVSGVTLEGVYGVTTLKMTVNSTAALHIGMPETQTRNVSDMVVRNIVFDGDYPTKTNNTGLSPQSVDGGLFENLIFKNHGYRALTAQVWDETQPTSRNLRFRNLNFLNDAVVLAGLEFCDFENLYFTGALPTQNTLMDLSFGELGTATQVLDTNFTNVWVDNLSYSLTLDPPFVGVFGSNQYVRRVHWNNVRVNMASGFPANVFMRAQSGLNPDNFCEDYRISNLHIEDAGNAIAGMVDTHVENGHIKNCNEAGVHNLGGGHLIKLKIENTNVGNSGTTFDKGCIYHNLALAKPVWIEDCEFLDTGSSFTPQALTVRNTSTAPIYMHNCKMTGPFSVSAVVSSNGGSDASSDFRGNPGFNPTNKITNFIRAGNTTIGPVFGTGNTIVASTDYTVNITDILIDSTSGTGVSITIKDGAGNTLSSGLTTLTGYYLPLGFKINWGAFSVAPTVVVCGN